MSTELQDALEKYKVAADNVTESEKLYRSAQKNSYELQDKVHDICKKLIEKELDGTFDVRIVLYPVITFPKKKS